jgi:hypothetical protein
MDDPTTTYHHPLPTIFWRTLIYKSTENPITPNQENTPGAINTFTRYPRMIENSNRETITLSKALLDQWMVRHGAYEQLNDPPSGHGGGMNIPRQGTHTTIPATNWTSNQTAEGGPHTHTTELQSRNLRHRQRNKLENETQKNGTYDPQHKKHPNPTSTV